MKNKLLSLCLCICLVCTMFVPVAHAAMRDPYIGINTITYDATTQSSPKITAGYLENAGSAKIYTYENVDFGEEGAYAVTLETGTTAQFAGQTASLYIDSTSSTPIASWKIEPSDWETPLGHYAELKTDIKGVHTVYLKSGGNTNYFNIRFYKNASAKDTYSVYEGMNYPFTDIKGHPYADDIAILYELGLIERAEGEDMYYPDLLITRGEFVDMLVSCLGNKQKDTATEIFPDVPKGSEHFEAVSLAYNMGLITGGVDGLFRPDEFILTNDAIVIVCRMLGYEAYAMAKGGYTGGYLTIANMHDVLDGLSITTYLTGGLMAKLIHNAIDAPFYDISSIHTGGSVSYELNYDGILSQSKGIYRSEGIVTANDITGAALPTAALSGSNVLINNTKYAVGNSMARMLLGYECDFYYKDTEPVGEILCIYPGDGVETETVAAPDSEITSIREGSVTYYDANGEEEELEFDSNCYIIYNGVAADTALTNLVSYPFFGSVRVVDNPNAKDTLFIDSYINIEVGSFDSTEKMIYDEIRKQYFRYGDEDQIYVNKDGHSVSFAELGAGDIVMLYASANTSGNRLVRMEASSVSHTGSVEETVDDKAVIAGVEYTFANECTRTLTPGDFVLIKVNAMGEIVTAEPVTGDMDFVAWLIDCGTENTSALTKISKIRVLDHDNVIKDYEFHDKCDVDGVSQSNGNIDIGFAAKDQPIRYRLNSKGKLTAIDTVIPGGGGDFDTLTKVLDKETNMVYNKTTRFMQGESRGINRCYLATDAKILTRWADDDDPETYDWISAFGSGSFTATAYSFDYSFGKADIVVRYKGSGSGDGTATNAFVYDHSVSVLGEDDEICTKLVGYDGTLKVEYLIKPGLYEQADLQSGFIRKGDWIAVDRDNQGYVREIIPKYFYGGEKVRAVYSYDDGKYTDVEFKAALYKDVLADDGIAIGEYGVGMGKGNRSYYPFEKYVYGTVVGREGNIIKLRHAPAFSDTTADGKNDAATPVEEFVNIGNGTVVRYDANVSNALVENGVANANVAVGDTILMEIIDSVTKQIYIVKE